VSSLLENWVWKWSHVFYKIEKSPEKSIFNLHAGMAKIALKNSGLGSNLTLN